MGGKGSGGTRVGAGRPAKEEAERWLGGHAGHRDHTPAALPNAERFGPPAGLPELHLEVWNNLAPHAFDAGTLTKGTAAAFRDLCEAIVVRDGILTAIHQAGYMNSDGQKHPLLPDYRGMYQRVESGMLKFRLAPIGKALVEAEKPKDPFAEFMNGGVQ